MHELMLKKLVNTIKIPNWYSPVKTGEYHKCTNTIFICGVLTNKIAAFAALIG